MSQRMFYFNGFCSAKLWNSWYDCDNQGFLFSRQKRAYSKCVSSLECGQRPLWFMSCDAQPWLRPLQQLNVTSSVKHLRISLKLVWPKFGNTIFGSEIYVFKYIFSIPPQFFLLKLQSFKGRHDSFFQSHLPNDSVTVVTVIHRANTTSLSQDC